MFGDGKLSYFDFWYYVFESTNGENGIKPFYVNFAQNVRYPIMVQEMFDDNGLISAYDFKGTAVGLYKNNPGDDPYQLAYTTKMRTDNATLHVNDNGTIRVWNMPFSEDGWYDVKYTSDSVADTNDWVFSNYNGDDSNRLSLDSGNGTVAINNVGGYTYEYVVVRCCFLLSALLDICFFCCIIPENGGCYGFSNVIYRFYIWCNFGLVN